MEGIMPTTIATLFNLATINSEIKHLSPDAPVALITDTDTAAAILLEVAKVNHVDHLTGLVCNLSNGTVSNQDMGALIEHHFPKPRKTSTDKLGGHYLCRQRNPDKYSVDEAHRSRVVLSGGRSGKMVRSTLDRTDSKVASLLAKFGL